MNPIQSFSLFLSTVGNSTPSLWLRLIKLHSKHESNETITFYSFIFPADLVLVTVKTYFGCLRMDT